MPTSHYLCVSRGPDGNFWNFDDQRPAFRIASSLASIRQTGAEFLVYTKPKGNSDFAGVKKRLSDAEAMNGQEQRAFDYSEFGAGPDSHVLENEVLYCKVMNVVLGLFSSPVDRYVEKHVLDVLTGRVCDCGDKLSDSFARREAFAFALRRMVRDGQLEEQRRTQREPDALLDANGTRDGPAVEVVYMPGIVSSEFAKYGTRILDRIEDCGTVDAIQDLVPWFTREQLEHTSPVDESVAISVQNWICAIVQRLIRRGALDRVSGVGNRIVVKKRLGTDGNQRCSVCGERWRSFAQ